MTQTFPDLFLSRPWYKFFNDFLTFPEHKGERTNFVKINDVSFRSKVTPGDRLEIDARLTKFKRGIANGQVEGRIKEDSVKVILQSQCRPY